METYQRQRSTDPIEDAEAARDELREALKEADILLPSLGIDTASFACEYMPTLVDLGRCNPAMARKLAAALRSANGQ